MADANVRIFEGGARLLDLRQRLELFVGCAGWIASIIYFWNWWLDPAHIIGPSHFLIVTVTLAWITFEPLYFLVVFAGARKPTAALHLPPRSRVAMVVTKAPSEP